VVNTVLKLFSWVLYFLGGCVTTFIHEGSHAVTTYLAGSKVYEFRPYPGQNGGAWLLGWIIVDRWPNSNRSIQLIYIAPLIAALFFCPVFLLLGIFVWKYFLVLAFLELLDVVLWIYDYFRGVEYTDAQRFRYYGRIK